MSVAGTSDVASVSALETLPASADLSPACEPIRLLKFFTYLAIGGTERQILNMVDGLDPRRFAVHLGCFGQLDPMGVDPGRTPLEIYRVGRLYGLRTMKEGLRLSRDLKQRRIDILHAYNFYANVFAVPAARLARVPVVLASIRDTGGYLTDTQRRVNRMACRLADRVVVNADAIKAGLIAEGYPAEKIVVIHNGIACPPLKTAAAKQAMRRTLNVPPDVPLVGVVARLTPPKGIEYFVEAARGVLARVPDARFVVVGDTRVELHYRERVKRQAARLGLQDRLTFTGFRFDIPEVLSALTVSVLPSVRGEGLSNALLEAMAAGVPVVATDIGGNPEVVVDGVTGFLVPSKDPAALAQAVCRLLGAPALAATMGQAGRRRVLEHFSVPKMIATTKRLYESLLEEARRRNRRPAAPAS